MIRTALLFALAACNGDVDFVPRTPEEVPPDPAPPDHGSWLSMDLAPDRQRVVIGYYDRELSGFGFAVGAEQEDGTIAWEHEQVDGYRDDNGLDTGDRGKYATIKVAPDGTVWAAYYDTSAKDLRYAHRTGGRKSWVTGTIDGTGAPDVGQWASLALNADGKPVVAYYDATGKILKVARLADAQDDSNEVYEWQVAEAWAGQPWSGTDAEGLPIERPADVGRYARLMIAGSTEYIAYYDAGQQRLGLLEGTAGNYTQSFVTEAGVNMGAWPSMLLDGGTLSVAFHDVQNQNLMVATRASGGFTVEVADAGDYVGADTELLQRGGALTVLYFDGQNNDMKLATKRGGEWVTETLGSADRAVGFHNEIVRVGNGFWAGSYDFTTRTVFTHRLPDPS
jgi:hypothetical protein